MRGIADYRMYLQKSSSATKLFGILGVIEIPSECQHFAIIFIWKDTYSFIYYLVAKISSTILILTHYKTNVIFLLP